MVDPDGVGTLVRRCQFHAMLRLVALEEAGLLPPLPADGAGDGASDSQSAGEVLTDALVRYAHLDIPLPTFDAVKMPTAAFLVGTYADAVRGQDQDAETTDSTGAECASRVGAGPGAQPHVGPVPAAADARQPDADAGAERRCRLAVWAI